MTVVAWFLIGWCVGLLGFLAGCIWTGGRCPDPLPPDLHTPGWRTPEDNASLAKVWRDALPSPHVRIVRRMAHGAIYFQDDADEWGYVGPDVLGPGARTSMPPTANSLTS
jgi:hypothetical protein